MINKTSPGHFTAMLVILIAIAGCASTKTHNWNRSEVPQINASISPNTSEIREIKYYPLNKEDGHKDLHIAGQIFTKSNAGGTSDIKPCGSCVVKLTSPTDTSIKINVTTESDGYFSYHGQNRPYILTLENGGHNRVEVGPVDFITEGTTFFKIINAAGGGSEKFTVIMSNKNYTWQ